MFLKQLTRCILPACLVVVALAVTYFTPSLRDKTSLLPFVIAVVISARIAGNFPSIVAAILSCFSWAYFIAEPGHVLYVSYDDLLRLALFLVIALLVGSLYSSREVARLRAVRTEERLNCALKSAGLAIWEFEINSNQLWTSEGFRSIWGIQDSNEQLSLARLQSLVHPEDRDTFIKAISKCIDDGSPFEVTHRTTKHPESIQTVGIRKVDASGKSQGLVGIATPHNLHLSSFAEKAAKLNEPLLDAIK